MRRRLRNVFGGLTDRASAATDSADRQRNATGARRQNANELGNNQLSVVCCSIINISSIAGRIAFGATGCGDPRLRYPVGPDALPFLGWRSPVSDEDWAGLGGLQENTDYFERVFTDTGIDLRSK